MSNTPRTDAQQAEISKQVLACQDDTFAEIEAWDFARQLERELNAANAEIAKLREEHDGLLSLAPALLRLEPAAQHIEHNAAVDTIRKAARDGKGRGEFPIT